MSQDDAHRFTKTLPQFVGVCGAGLSDELKRDTLLFDRIAIPGLDRIVRRRECPNHEELDFLRQQGIVYEPTIPESEPLEWVHEQAVRSLSSEVIPDDARLDEMNSWPEQWRIEFSRNLHRYAAWNNTGLLITSELLRQDGYLDSVAVFNGRCSFARSGPVAKRSVVHVVLSAFPMPNDATTWQEILEFRADPENAAYMASLRGWMSELSRADLTENETAQKCEYLLQTRKRYLELHRLKVTTGHLETVLTTTAEALENLLKGRLGRLVKDIFGIMKSEMEFEQTKMSAPGLEVAYIFEAIERFGT